jgi:hypothetical protein
MHRKKCKTYIDKKTCLILLIRERYLVARFLMRLDTKDNTCIVSVLLNMCLCISELFYFYQSMLPHNSLILNVLIELRHLHVSAIFNDS